MIAYKLFHQRKDGSLGPLFINKRRVIPIGAWLQAEDHPTKGYAHRPGWHVAGKCYAPHLTSKKEKRVWKEVEIHTYTNLPRPASQGNMWYLAEWIKVL
jgi:hypothetical protein